MPFYDTVNLHQSILSGNNQYHRLRLSKQSSHDYASPYISFPQVRGAEETNGTLVTSEDQLNSSANLSLGSGHLSANKTQVTFVEKLKDAQSCIAIDPPPQGNGVPHKPFGQLFSAPQNVGEQTGKEKSGGGVGGLASLWFRGKQKQPEDKTRLDSSKQTTTNKCTNGEQKTKAEEMWKEMSKHLDTICFWVFLTAWLIVTLGFLIAMFT
ncbi:hypothetical protein ElyMa_001916700 [Elysia marginata]|uniref:Uncharacterized protein n=1 Tax=Elysia marginata TaxID=1093978 RepID=A0AAV4ETB1_9GAST|nr:hypothetical protein ElyMa_001916700 [Elysia marginata]